MTNELYLGSSHVCLIYSDRFGALISGPALKKPCHYFRNLLSSVVRDLFIVNITLAWSNFPLDVRVMFRGFPIGQLEVSFQRFNF